MNITTLVRVFEKENETTKENLPCLCTIYSLANESNNDVIAVAILSILLIMSVIALSLLFIKPIIDHHIASYTEAV